MSHASCSEWAGGENKLPSWMKADPTLAAYGVRLAGRLPGQAPPPPECFRRVPRCSPPPGRTPPYPHEGCWGARSRVSCVRRVNTTTTEDAGLPVTTSR